MKDLRDAIKMVVENAKLKYETRYGCIGNIPCWSIPDKIMQNLVSEYNIHFVEPEDKQLEL